MLVVDLRTSSWLLMSSPWPSLLIVAAYFVVVYGGQKVMAKRQAFDLKTLIMVYNVCLVLLSAYMCWEVGVAIATKIYLKIITSFSFYCN